MSDYVQQNATLCAFKNADSWVILSPIEQSIKAKIEKAGTPLKDWDINIYRGVLTGCNEAFIITGEKRNEILSNCNSKEDKQRTEELIRPILRGRDIKRYGYEFADLYLIATFPAKHYNIEDFPAVRDYLLSFGKERLEQTGKTYIVKGENIKARKKTNNKWFETQDSISYWEDFYKQKIAWASVGATFYSKIDSEQFLLDTNYFFSTENPEYLLAILNSKLIITWINSEDTPIGGGGAFRHYKYNLEKLSIPILSTIQQKPFINLITQILEKQKQNENTHNLEKQIDQKVYELYNLTKEEIKYIEDI